jgi:hypothetical protein
VGDVRSGSVSGVYFEVMRSGVVVRETRGPTRVVLSLEDVRQLVLDGMAESGWEDWFREELRDLFAGVAACEVCGSIRGVSAHGWDGALLCERHLGQAVERERLAEGL